MKHSTKQHAPSEYTDWLALSNDNWRATYESLRNPEKASVKESLLTEPPLTREQISYFVNEKLKMQGCF